MAAPGRSMPSRRAAVELLLLAGLLLGLTFLVYRGASDSVDLSVYEALLPWRTGGAAQAAGVVVALATPTVVALAMVGLAVLLAARERSTSSLRMLLPPVLAVVVVVLAGKALLHRCGPPGTRAVGLLGYYPSGHTATSLVCAGVVAHLVAVRRPARRLLAWGIAAAWAALVAAAMVLRGYHWLTDVLGAALVGALILRLHVRQR